MAANSRTLYILVGASCAGKTGFMKKALLVAGDRLGVVTSITTRKFREPPFLDEDKLSYGRSHTREEYDEMRARGKLWSDVEYRGESYGLSDAEFDRVLTQKDGIIPLVPEVAEKCWERYQRKYNVIILILHPTPSRLFDNMRHRGITDPKTRVKILREAKAIATRRWRVPVTPLCIGILEDYEILSRTIFRPKAEDSFWTTAFGLRAEDS